MKTAQLGDYFDWNGQIVRVEWMSEGKKSIGFKVKTMVTCPHCKEQHEIIEGYDVIESSPMFQENANPIKSITEK